MSAPVDTGAAQAATRGVSRGRGRGGRGGNIRPATRIPKASEAKGKIGPNRLLEIDWIKDSILRDNCFTQWIGAGNSGDQQWTFHRPIGETELDDARDWVATPTRDINFLLQRRESEALSAWKRKKSMAIRQFALSQKRGRCLDPDESEIWAFVDAPAIQPTIRTCMAAAKAAGKPESSWLDFADRAVQTAERSFKEALRTGGVPASWPGENPRPEYETRGGPLGDQPQKAIEYLNGYSTAAARDRVLCAVLGIAMNDSVPRLLTAPEEEDSESESEAEPTASASSPKGGPKGSPKGKGAK